MFFGIGSAISSIIMGKIIDCTSSKKAIWMNLITLVLTLAMTIINLNDSEYRFSIMTAFMWGFEDGVI